MYFISVMEKELIKNDFFLYQKLFGPGNFNVELTSLSILDSG